VISENTIEIEWRGIDSLTPYINNARSHSERQIEQIAASIKEFGFTNPVLVDGGNGIIAGHGRVMAAKKIKMDKIPVIELAYLTDTQKRAYIIADNQLALNAGWDDGLLKAELQDLQAIDFNMDLLGFELEELEDLIIDKNMAPDSSTKEINPDAYELKNSCPRCGFEYDDHK
jgi:ParB-like chromosome segregation protein Spo0J